MNKWLVIGGVAWAMGCGGALAACPSDLAIYSQVADPSASASLTRVEQPRAFSDVRLTINTKSRSHEFEFTESNGYAVQYLLPVKANGDLIEDSGQDATITFFDENLHVLPLPQSGKPAPTYFFAPQVGSIIYYGYDPRELIPIGMWKLSGCAE